MKSAAGESNARVRAVQIKRLIKSLPAKPNKATELLDCLLRGGSNTGAKIVQHGGVQALLVMHQDSTVSSTARDVALQVLQQLNARDLLLLHHLPSAEVEILESLELLTPSVPAPAVNHHEQTPAPPSKSLRWDVEGRAAQHQVLVHNGTSSAKPSAFEGLHYEQGLSKLQQQYQSVQAPPSQSPSLRTGKYASQKPTSQALGTAGTRAEEAGQQLQSQMRIQEQLWQVATSELIELRSEAQNQIASLERRCADQGALIDKLHCIGLQQLPAEELYELQLHFEDALVQIGEEWQQRAWDENQRLRFECEQKLCLICEDREKCIVFLPCGHLSVCETCFSSVTLKNCPNCRASIEKHIKVYS